MVDGTQNQQGLRVDVSGHQVEAFKDARDWNVGQIQIVNHNSDTQGSSIVALLKPIHNASHTRNRALSPPNSRCFPGTREKVIKKINSWINSSLLFNNPHIMWIYGYAGCGKSAIAQVISEQMASQGRLAASFFFFRGSGERSTAKNFAVTVASQLAAAIPEIAPIIRAVIDATPGLISPTTSELSAQFQHFVYDPIDQVKWDRLASSFRHGPFLIVLDGVDECGDRVDISAFIEHMIEYFNQRPRTPLRFLVTSRVETHLHQRLHSSKQVRLLDLVQHTSDDDISAALAVAIEKEKAQRVLGCNPSWPTSSDRLKLVKHIGRSYIFMNTIIKLLFDEQHTDGMTPMDRLPLVLATSPNFDGLYRAILSPWTNLPHFCDILSTIALVQAPLSITQIADMLEIRTVDVVYVLINLHAIMQIPGDDHTPVTLWHTSLRDFLCSKDRAGPFYASPTYHLHIAFRCAAVSNERSGISLESPLLDYSKKFRREHLMKSAGGIMEGTSCVFDGKLGDIAGALNKPVFDGRTALEVATRAGRWNLVQCLVNANADVNTRFETSEDGILVTLHAACDLKEQDMTYFLLENGADPNVVASPSHKSSHWGLYPLTWAIGRGDVDLVNRLLACGADPNRRGKYRKFSFSRNTDLKETDYSLRHWF